MPIFQEYDAGRRPASRKTTPLASPSPPIDRNVRRKASEESIRTELCEGLVLDASEDEEIVPTGTVEFPRNGISDRIELIERLKRGESPTWLPNRNLESLLQEHEQTPRKQSPAPTASSPLLPSPGIAESQQIPSNDNERLQAGLQIERPRSALHSGDFTEGTQIESSEDSLLPRRAQYREERSQWIATSPPRQTIPFHLDTRFSPGDGSRSRAPSLSSSYSSSFVLRPPTSPLVHSESNEDGFLSSRINPIDISPAYQPNPRRHTLQSQDSVHSTPSLPTMSNFSKPLPHLRRDHTYPYQAHQPRRSLTLNQITNSPSPSPQTPSFLRSRRPSFSDSSPLHHASMVGSYEESILRGRMSTTPSKPLDFVAQIGVLGIGKCKPSLRCPAHVTIPFPAVFYSYETTTHGRSAKSEDGPSPYVGQIDLEGMLANQDENRDNKRKRLNANLGRSRNEDLDMVDGPNTNQLSEQDIRRMEKQKRRSTSPRAPPGGSYRIPEKGQLQIIIKNPNKTAVKLFLVPYDLSGMEPGTKTFIRQRSYSAGPIIDTALSSSPRNLANNTSDRSTLRYLVHLQICSPARGRFYLYKSIRVVFANRVPDGKEKLRNEVSLPEPRFSVYKPGRDSILGHTLTSSVGASLAAEKAYRRRSSGFVLGASNRAYDSMDGIAQTLERAPGDSSVYPFGRLAQVPVQPIPFGLYRKPVRYGEDNLQDSPNKIQSPDSGKSSRPTSSDDSGRPMSWESNIGYDKLNKGDAGYGGNPFNGSPDGKQAVAEGLLAKKLRDLGVGLQNQQDQADGI